MTSRKAKDETQNSVDAGKPSAENNDFLVITNLVYNFIPIDKVTSKASLKAMIWLTDLKTNPCVRDNWLTEIQGFVAGLWTCGVITNDNVRAFKQELEDRKLRVIPENFKYLTILNYGNLTLEYLNEVEKKPRPAPTPSEHAAKLEIIRSLRKNRVKQRTAKKQQIEQTQEQQV